MPEPEAQHIALAEKLVFSDNPSACANFPGNIVICRNYDRLEKQELVSAVDPGVLQCPGERIFGSLRVICTPAEQLWNEPDHFTVSPCGPLVVRSRQSGDAMRLSGGTKSLKKLFVDKKIPASRRHEIPVIADEGGVLGVYGFGANKDRPADAFLAVDIRFETTKEERE